MISDLWYSSWDGRAEGEHVNRGRDTQDSALAYRCSICPPCYACFGCYAAEFGSYGETYELLCIFVAVGCDVAVLSALVFAVTTLQDCTVLQCRTSA